MKSFTSLLLATALVLTAPLVTADVLLIDAISEAPANAPDGLPRPHRGQSMQTVRSRFGEPIQSIAAVGEPPISRWVYDKYTVYFEHQYVIETVVHHK